MSHKYNLYQVVVHVNIYEAKRRYVFCSHLHLAFSMEACYGCWNVAKITSFIIYVLNLRYKKFIFIIYFTFVLYVFFIYIYHVFICILYVFYFC